MRYTSKAEFDGVDNLMDDNFAEVMVLLLSKSIKRSHDIDETHSFSLISLYESTTFIF